MINVSLQHMVDIVVTCNMLHNMCAISKNKLDKEWIDKVKIYIEEKTIGH